MINWPISKALVGQMVRLDKRRIIIFINRTVARAFLNRGCRKFRSHIEANNAEDSDFHSSSSSRLDDRLDSLRSACSVFIILVYLERVRIQRKFRFPTKPRKF